MAAMVAMQRHLWLNLFGIKEREKFFLLGAPLSCPGLCCDTVNTVAFQRYIPHRVQVLGVAPREQPQPSTRGEVAHTKFKCAHYFSLSSGVSGRSCFQLDHCPVSASKHCRSGMFAPSEEGIGEVCLVVPCQQAVSGHWAYYSAFNRG